MKLLIQSITFLLTSLFFIFSVTSQVKSQTPASPSSSMDEITQNVKKRIQGVIEDQRQQNTQSVIYGKLNSIVTNTLSINHDDGIKLASTSATTQYLRLPGNTKLGFDDLAIDEFVIVVGLKNESDVIDAFKVISQKTPPVKSEQKAFYGNLYTYDTKKFLLDVLSPVNNETKTFQVGRKSNVFLGNPDGTKTKIDRKQDLPVQSQVLVLFEATDEKASEPLVQEMLVIPSSPIITPAELKP